MKKVILLCILYLLSINSNAQDKDLHQMVNDTVKKYENAKSGNYKDILTSFFQLATTNFTGSNKTIEMNTTLFAIKAKANPELTTGNFQEERFSRNFQFNFKLNIDDKYKYKGFTGGATYAIVNGRDRKLAVLTKTIFGKQYEPFQELIQEIYRENKFINQTEADNFDAAYEDIMNLKTYSANDFHRLLLSKFKEKAKKYNIKEDNMDVFAKSLKKLSDNEYKKIDSKALWTLSVDGSAQEKGKFNKASIGTIFLQGIKEKSEIDARAKIVYADTLTIAPMPRMDFNAKLGVNFKIAKGYKNVSYFEIKGSMEYNKILKNIMPNEKKEIFLGNAEIRVRLANDLWLPLIIKYDIENSNFLGFLNLSYNFGALK
jgi:hypothetical protein